MFPVSVSQVVSAINGQLISGPPDVPISSVSIDSRTVERGGLFAAFVGAKVDGHCFIPQALRNGACAILATRNIAEQVPASVAVILTENPLLALQRLAHFERSFFSGPVVAVTGSNGKTTTKEMLRQVFSVGGAVLATEKNQNNELGLPLTLLKLNKTHQSVVVEMGMRARGEIAALCEIAEPFTGVITNIGQSHLEILGSQEQIALAKTELLQSLPENGTAILNGGDPWLRKLANLSPCRTLWFGFTPDCDAFAENIQSDGNKTSFTAQVLGGSCHVRLPQLGRHNVLNALSALLAGAANGLDLPAMVEQLEHIQSNAGRLQQVPGKFGRLIIDDCYNASPSSVKASLEVLMELAKGRPSVAILGDMFELGSYEEQGHLEVGSYAAKIGVSRVIAVGTLAKKIKEGVEAVTKLTQGRSGERACQTSYYKDKATLLSELEKVLPPEATVLVKASRAMELEDIVGALRE